MKSPFYANCLRHSLVGCPIYGQLRIIIIFVHPWSNFFIKFVFTNNLFCSFVLCILTKSTKPGTLKSFADTSTLMSRWSTSEASGKILKILSPSITSSRTCFGPSRFVRNRPNYWATHYDIIKAGQNFSITLIYNS